MAISRRTEALAPTHWSVDVLRRLDWKRFQDLAGTMLNRAGYLTEPERIKDDGGRVLSIRRGSRRENRPESLIFLAGWNSFRITEGILDDFSYELDALHLPHGVIITPGYFSKEAARMAKPERFELIDGLAFLETLQDLPEADQDWLIAVTTAGDYAVPTCPRCGAKMVWRESDCPPHNGPLEDLSFADRSTVLRGQRANTVAIGRAAEVTFMNPVFAKRLSIEGRASGHFIIDGPVTMGPSAVVTGLISARSIKIEPGGLFDGDAAICGKGEVEPVRPLPFHPVWGCPAYPSCKMALDPRPIDLNSHRPAKG